MWSGPFGWVAIAVFLIIATITSVVLLSGGPDRSEDAYLFVRNEIMYRAGPRTTVTAIDDAHTKVVAHQDGRYVVSGRMSPSDAKLAPGVKRSPKGEILFTANVAAEDSGPLKPTEWRILTIKYETP